MPPPSMALNGPRREKACLRGFANNTGADQPAHPLKESPICRLATDEISIY